MGVTPDDQVEPLIRAQGIALATLEALLISKGVIGPGELSERLEGMAQVTGEVDAEASIVLSAWAEMLAQVDEAQAGGETH